AASAAWAAQPAMLDILAFGEAGHIALRRGSDGRPAAMRLGAVQAPATASDGPVVLTVSRSDGGTLSIAGPMVPHSALRQTAPPAQAEGAAYDTGHPCRVDAASGTLSLSGARPGLGTIGGYS